MKTRTAVGLQAPHATPVLRSKSHAVSKSGLMSVSEQLRAYPSPNQTLTLDCYQSVNSRWVGEEKVRSCSDTDIDLYLTTPQGKTATLTQGEFIWPQVNSRRSI